MKYAETSRQVRDLRRGLGLTQEAFAQALGITVSTVNRWENGHAKPSAMAWRLIRLLRDTQPSATP